ncbi:hypothetical protein GQ457_06G007270 [Hibiscus cannabinus]
MRIVSWNVRGLGSATKRRGVQDLLRKQHYDMAILLESKWDVATQFEGVAGGRVPFCVCSIGRGVGGILVIWNSSRFCLDFSDILSHCVVIKGSWAVDSFSCGLMAVYAPCGTTEQFTLWGELRLYLEEGHRAWAAHRKEEAWRLRRVELQLESEKACRRREKMEEIESKIKALREEQNTALDRIETEYREQLEGLRREKINRAMGL